MFGFLFTGAVVGACAMYAVVRTMSYSVLCGAAVGLFLGGIVWGMLNGG